MNVAINQFKVSTIKAITTKENQQSQKLLEKLGLKHTALIKMPGDDEELMLYRI